VLFVSGFGANAPMSELTALKKRVDQCIRWFPITGSNDTAASEAVTCDMQVGGSGGQDGIRAFEKLTLIDPADNVLMFDIASAIVGGWRNTGMDGRPSPTEENVRRIAAQKLGESAVFDFSPTQAVQLLAQVGRVEPSNVVKVAIIRSLHVLLKTRDIPPTVRAEAMTTLKTFADANVITNTVEVLNAANDALKDLAIKLEIGPVTVVSLGKPRSKYFIPLVAMGITAVAATGGLILFFRHQDARGLSAAGPLRRKAEAALQRRKAR
jgi:hypothetical protein